MQPVVLACVCNMLYPGWITEVLIVWHLKGRGESTWDVCCILDLSCHMLFIEHDILSRDMLRPLMVVECRHVALINDIISHIGDPNFITSPAHQKSSVWHKIKKVQNILFQFKEGSQDINRFEFAILS